MAVKRLTRDMRNKMIGGVCSGLANYLDIDPTIVRIVWALLILGAGFGLLAYIICWIVIPQN
ncbi:MAG TPA: PspC domain-containing protein [Bacillota bacterium]|nr:PspC domain-containing protein [Bacillota bacterium]HOH10236.1 PspC domain-containing protein [Bacillota bacterium]HOY88616.1 PspC domain-containing protein [Bacillota bacterium]HPI01198.1 PspC domain-containing protein [Bacillota bacterium]HPM63549.1 PspC domain-containing protein [Bacillota bacterium]